VTALAHVPVAYRLAARSADVVFVTPEDTAGAAAIVAEVRAHEAEIDRRDPPLRIFADLVVLLDPDARAARGRQDRLDDLAGRPLRSDAYVHTGTPGDLADLLEAWHGAGVDGFRLRPAVLPGDLDAVTDQLVPLLQARSSFRRRYEHRTLRGRLGLSRPESRYATGQRGAGAGGGRR
jgi:alkanesulfonate monooxygenase SsuD/methylene tetrahydromethanopterin reductase-like flavin-dependent oxidoreductase (luciferase family)